MGFIVFLYGIVIGSFLNVCIYRIPNNQSLISPPSHCGNCDTRLKWKDLIPIGSYLWLKGKCRYCDSKISMRYPLVEGLTGILLVGIYLRYGIGLNFFKYSLLTLFLIVIALIDYDTTDVYSSVVYSGMAVGIIFIIIEAVGYSHSITTYIIGGLIGLGVIGLIYVLTGGMGAGDIEIAVLCGLFLGWKLEIYFLLISFIIGGSIAVTLIALKKKLKDEYIPLGPSLAMGAYIVLIIGEQYILNFI
ncbi:A24 family peptidase [Clostridium subterminale]|uniref:A24 family peptidase n=1 Tax=Clostridium subterminale TaxID=1550 RepID=A0ABP3W749_CLOSU